MQNAPPKTNNNKVEGTVRALSRTHSNKIFNSEKDHAYI
jgi:hypothetical protein